MRNLIIKDSRINKDDLFELMEEYTAFWDQHADIDVTYLVEQKDFREVPTQTDSDGDIKPTVAYRKQLVKDAIKRHGTHAFDNIVMLVHEDNWYYKGIWGQNWSYIYGPVSFQLSRWDRDNPANTFGTLYHEQMHPVDAFIKKEVGVNINKDFHGAWDKHVVHGGRPDEVGKHGFEYIRYKENTDALRQVSKLLKQAFLKRELKHKQQQLSLLLRLRDLALKLRDLLLSRG